MTKESLIIVCSNPRCRKEFEESIRLTILSVTPPKQYEACPYCFAKLEQEPPIKLDVVPKPQFEQNLVSEPSVEHEERPIVEEEEKTIDNISGNMVREKVKDSGHGFFKKIKALIPSNNGSKKEKTQKTKEPTAEPFIKKEEASKETPNESSGYEEITKDKTKHEESVNNNSGSSGCPETFGYLANRPQDVPIPQGCLICLQMVDCMLKIEAD